MPSNNSGKHLTLDERRIILEGIKNGSSYTAIAEILGKNKSTIGREIKQHRILTHRMKLALECANYQKCKYGRACFPNCKGYVPFKCNRRDISPGACNGCSNYMHCQFNKYMYNAENANKEYKELLTDSRQGVNMTTSEAEKLGNIVAPLIRQGLSPYQIVTAHPELNICEKTLYNYISMGLFCKQGIADIDLRQKVKRKSMKKTDMEKYKKRQDHKYLKGRLYSDYLAYLEENPDTEVVQMDTVYNDETNGPFIQTFKFIKYGFLFAVYHTNKTADNMVSGVNLLESIMGKHLFIKYVNLLLTDRGCEFVMADNLETDTDGYLRTKVFYCDPMSSGQKGSLENNHKELRYILPKKTDLYALGLTGQDKLNIVLSNVDSAAKEHLNGKSAFEYLEFMAPDLYQKFVDSGITHIKEKDTVILKPYLLK